jgi:hypothetical protein
VKPDPYPWLKTFDELAAAAGLLPEPVPEKPPPPFDPEALIGGVVFT